MIGLELQNPKAKDGLAKFALGNDTKTASKGDGKFSMLLNSLNMLKGEGSDKFSSLLGVTADAGMNLNEEGDSKSFFNNKSILSLLGKLDEAGDLEKGESSNSHGDLFKSLNLGKAPSIGELKELIFKAKNYLKEQISKLSSEDEIKNMPKSLNGLIKLAEKKGINVEKITLETIKGNAQNIENTDTKAQEKKVLDQLTPKSKVVIKQDETPKSVNKTQEMTPKAEALKNILELKEKIKDEGASTQSRQTLHVEQKAEQKSLHVEQKSEQKSLHVEQKAEQKTLHVEQKSEQKSLHVEQKSDAPGAKNIQTKSSEPLNISQTAQNTGSKEETKNSHSENANAKKTKGSTLVTPSSTQHAQNSATNELKNEPSKPLFNSTLTQLLKGESKESDEYAQEYKEEAQLEKHTSKSELASNISKAKETLTLKANEAKQMLSTLSQNLKEAVENYKPPFTRLTMKLNPDKLGDVNVTLVQRGGNVHININSNNQAIQLMAQNMNELRTQLAQNGLTNANLNFTNSDSNQNQNQNGGFGNGNQNSQNHAQQQQQREQREAQYTHYEREKHHEEVIDNLEIILPNYV